MKQTIRTRYFLWLTGILLVFFLLNSFLLLGINLREILAQAPNWKEELYEWLIITATGLAALPLAILAAWKVSLWMLAPLQQMIRTANHIEAGNFDERLHVSDAHDEIASLAVSLNRALDRYQTAMERQRQFNDTASHQLRTPLATIRTQGEVALQKNRSTAEYREVLATILEVCSGMEKAVEQLLMLARLRNEDILKAFAAVPVHALFETLLQRYEPLHASKDIAVDMDTPEGLQLLANRELLLQALANVFDNAITYSPVRGQIRLSASPLDTRMVELAITDQGPGLPPAYLQDTHGQHNRKQGGKLGLLIVEMIMRLHGGHVVYANNEGGGACVKLLLPQQPACREVPRPVAPINRNTAKAPEHR